MKGNAVCLLNEEGGQGLVEYSLILSLIVIGAIAAVNLFGSNLKIMYQETLAKMP